MNIKKSIVLRVRIAFIILSIFALAVIFKIGHIQFVQGEYWDKVSNDYAYKFLDVKATRGSIYSDNGSLLATSLPFYKVAMDPTIPSAKLLNKQNLDSLSYQLSNFFKDKSPSRYKQMIQSAREEGDKYIVFGGRTVNYLEKRKIMNWPIFRKGRMKGGLIFEKKEERFRPFNNLGYRTIGYINEEEKGVVGLEYSFNNFLKGRDGKAWYQKISGGKLRPVYDESDIKTEDGLDIQTSIDINLQDVTETALHKALDYHQAEYGTAVVMEVATGEIKAISNLGRTSSGKYFEKYNYAIGRQGVTEPGSTFKLATMMALLEETNISLNDSIETGNGTYKFYNSTVRDHHAGGYGMLSIQDAFEKSSNIAMAKLVDQHFGVDPGKFLSYIDDLKMSGPIGFQLYGEGVPKIVRPSDTEWSGITLPWMSYGYGLEMTPMHTLMLYNAVANNGKMIKPILVKSVRKAEKELERYDTEVLNNQICSEPTLRKLKIMLEGVVERGTANNIKNSYYKIAGKTGTAQILKNGRYTKTYVTSFVGYFPASKPKYSAIILIKDPKGHYQYGASVAAPVFKEIADNIYSRDIELHQSISEKYRAEKGVFPVIRAGKKDELMLICNELGISNHTQTEQSWVKTAVSGNSVKWKELEMKGKALPDLIGLTLRDAIYLLEQQGWKVRYSGLGRVVSQSVPSGTQVEKGKTIHLNLG